MREEEVKWNEQRRNGGGKYIQVGSELLDLNRVVNFGFQPHSDY